MTTYEKNHTRNPIRGRMPKTRRASIRVLAVVTALLTVQITALVVTATPAQADHGISTTANVNLRTGPASTYASLGIVPAGTSPAYLCWTRGEAVHGLNVWFKVTYNSQTGYISSYYDNSHYAHAEDIPALYGIPGCDSSTPPPTTTPPPSSGGGAAIVAAAASMAGKPYCFAGGNQSGPTHGSGGSGCPGSTVGFDCSGLSLYAVYKGTGTLLAHKASTQAGGGTWVDRANLQPGDLVFFGTSMATATHVGVYAGNGQMWDARDYNYPVALHNLYSNYIGARRYWTAPPPTTSPVAQYANTIVKWDGDSVTSWYVSPDLKRLWIPDGGTYNQLKARGVAGPYVLSSTLLNQLPDQTNQWVASGSSWGKNRTLRRGMSVRSSDGRYLFTMQTDGNLVLYGPSGRALWATNRYTSAWTSQEYVIFQGDGNLVTYGGGRAIWASNTAGRGGDHFEVQSDGNLVIYRGSTPLWASNTVGQT